MRTIFMLLTLTLLAGHATAETTQIINEKALFPEGPTLADGKLVYAEYAGHVVTVWDGSKNSTLWKQDGCGPSAVVPLGSNFGITCYDSGQLVIISADGKTIKTFDKDAAGNKLLGPNDGTPDGKGGAYFTLSGPWESGPIVGRVVHLSADGELRAAANDLHYANGIVLGRDGRLYVNESEAGRVISFSVDAAGVLSDRRLFIRLFELGEPANSYPDGIKVGPNGNFFVGTYSGPVILEVSPDGKTLANKYTLDSKAAPNLAFSADGKTMYVMAVDNTSAAPYEGRVIAVPVK